MRANVQPRVKADPNLERELKEHATIINLMTDGRLSGTNNATTAAPTTGVHARGDFVRNSQPSEAGAAASKYVVLGWVCTAGGEPGTWLACRVLTGN
jgi:hypothetical protein